MIFTNANIHIRTISRLVLGVLGVAGVLGYFCLTRSLQASICHMLCSPPPKKKSRFCALPGLGTSRALFMLCDPMTVHYFKLWKIWKILEHCRFFLNILSQQVANYSFGRVICNEKSFVTDKCCSCYLRQQWLC